MEYYSVTHNIIVLTFLYMGLIFLPFRINTHYSAVRTAQGHRTVGVTQPYMPSPPLLGLVADPGQLEGAGSLTADRLPLQTVWTHEVSYSILKFMLRN